MVANSDKKIILRFVSWFFLVNSIVFCLLGYGYLDRILNSSSLFVNSLADYSSTGGKLFIVFFAVVNYLTYMALLGFIPALIPLLLTCIFPYKKFITGLSLVLAILSVIVLLVNNSIYSMFKFHLNAPILKMVLEGQWFDLFDFSQRELEIAIGFLLVISFLEFVIAGFVWKKISETNQIRVGQTIAWCWLGGFVFSYFTLLQSITQNNNLFSQQTPNLPFYNQLLIYLIPDKNAEDVLYRYSEEHFSQPLFSNEPLHYPLQPMQCSKPAKPPNIIFIMVDSLRFDSLNSHYMPQVTQFANNNWQFEHYLSGGNATQPGLFTLFYSIPSNYWTAALEQNIPPVFIQLLLKYNYATQILWSSEMVNPPFDRTIYQGIHVSDPQGSPGDDIANRDRNITQKAIQFLSNKTTKQPFFLNLFYDAPHGYCREQNMPQLYQPAIKECSRIAMSNEVDALPYYNRYLNTVTFIDGEVGRILATIEKEGYLDNSIVLITADHGQEFNDNKQNYWGHAGNFSAPQIHVPLIIHWPGEKSRKIYYLTSSYDVMPTLLQRIFQCTNQTIDYSIGQNLLQKGERLPFILAGSYSNMGIIESDRLTTLRTSGTPIIMNLNAEPLPAATPRMDRLKEALALMRLYYAKEK